MIGLAELCRRAPEGVCPFCGEPAAPRSSGYDARRKREAAQRSDFALTCNAPECRVTAYQRYWRRDQRAARSDSNTP